MAVRGPPGVSDIEAPASRAPCRPQLQGSRPSQPVPGLGLNGPDCVIDVGGWPHPSCIDIPGLMLSVSEREGIIAELAEGRTARVTPGAIAGIAFEQSSLAVLSDPGELDPNSANSGDVRTIDTGLFAVAFERGGRWAGRSSGDDLTIWGAKDTMSATLTHFGCGLAHPCRGFRGTMPSWIALPPVSMCCWNRRL